MCDVRECVKIKFGAFAWWRWDSGELVCYLGAIYDSALIDS